MTEPIPARTTCRACGSSDLTPLFSLGEQFVSDFVAPDRVQAGIRCPIELDLCNGCTMAQLRHTAPQDFLYTRHYWYASGRNATMRAALRDVTAAIEARVDLQPGDVVLDIGSNDGTLLRSYTRTGLVRVGVEPATNMVEHYLDSDIYMVNEFWSADDYDFFAKVHCGGAKPKAITAAGMMYDLPDPNPFIADIAKALHPDGVFVAQLMCAKNMLAVGDVGNVCHEHLEFYSLRSLALLFGRHGLKIVGLETNAVNGESYRLWVQHANRPNAVTDRDLIVGYSRALSDESERLTVAAYREFHARMEANRAACVAFVRGAVAAGKTVAVYGASTKGNVIIQYFGLDSSLIAFASDRSPEKAALCMVGSGIPIVSEEEGRRRNPDYFLVLPYAFRAEFMEREKAWHQGDHRFIFPLPTFEVV